MLTTDRILNFWFGSLEGPEAYPEDKASRWFIKNEKVDGTVSVEAGMDLQEKAAMNYAVDAGMEIHHKAGMSLVIESAVNLTLKVGGNFVNINPGGIFIQGTIVMVNAGGAAGSGGGSSPEKPKLPQEAEEASPGDMGRDGARVLRLQGGVQHVGGQKTHVAEPRGLFQRNKEGSQRIVLISFLRIGLVGAACRDGQHHRFASQMVTFVAVSESMLENEVLPFLEDARG